jgi:hypothetical protein
MEKITVVALVLILIIGLAACVDIGNAGMETQPATQPLIIPCKRPQKVILRQQLRQLRAIRRM